MFILSEPLVRAIAKTCDADLDAVDNTGGLALSTIKYVTLLDRAEAAWEDSVSEPSPVFLPRQMPYGRRTQDWRAEVLPATAASSQLFAKPSSPMRWHDPQGKFEATTFPPDAIEPDDSTTIEVSFGKGEQFSDDATELIGANVRLGGAQGVIQTRRQGDAEYVYVSLRYSQVITVAGSSVELFVNGELWT